MTMIPQYSELLDVLGVIKSERHVEGMSLDDALKDGQQRAEEAMNG